MKNVFYFSRQLFLKKWLLHKWRDNFLRYPPKNGSLVAVDEDIFFEALSFASSRGY